MPDAITGTTAVLGVAGLNESKNQADASQALQAEQLKLEQDRDKFNREQIEEMNKWTREDRADFMDRRDRTRALYDPLEERQIEMQKSVWDLADQGPDYAGAISRSDADVAQAYGVEREKERRRMERYGVNPASGASAAMSMKMGNAEALAKTFGRNRARLQEDDKDWSRRIAALGTGNYTDPSMRSQTSNTNLAQLGVSGASGVLGNMSNAAGMNASGAAQFAGSMAAEGMRNWRAYNANNDAGVQMPRPNSELYRPSDALGEG